VVWGPGFNVWALGLGICGGGFGVRGLGFGVWGLELGCTVHQQQREHPRRRERESPCKRARESSLLTTYWSESTLSIDNLLARIHIIWWNGLAPWEFEFPVPGILISTCLEEWRHEEWTSSSESIPDAASASPPANAREKVPY